MNPYPLKPPILDMDVASQHNNVGADNWRHEIAELNMYITQDILLVITARKIMIK